MTSFWRRINPNYALTAGATILAALITSILLRPKSVEQTRPVSFEPKDAKSAAQPQNPEAQQPSVAPPLQSPSAPQKTDPAPDAHRKAHTLKSDSILTEMRTRKLDSTEPVSTVNAEEAAKTRAIILKKQDTWSEKHPGITARYREGKADKAEIEQAIDELEIIKGLAVPIGYHEAEQWAEQRIIKLQFIDVKVINSRNKY